MNWNLKEATIRAVRTFLQTFTGTLATVAVALDRSYAYTATLAAVSAGIAAIAAFSINLGIEEKPTRRR